jgi:hypothetical protein
MVGTPKLGTLKLVKAEYAIPKIGMIANSIIVYGSPPPRSIIEESIKKNQAIAWPIGTSFIGTHTAHIFAPWLLDGVIDNELATRAVS